MSKPVPVEIISTVRIKLLVVPREGTKFGAEQLSVREASDALMGVLSRTRSKDWPFPNCLVEAAELDDTYVGLVDPEM